MIIQQTTDIIDVITDAAINVDVHCSWIDNVAGSITPGRANTLISTATTTTVCPAPGSNYRNMRTLNIRNRDTGTSVNVTVRHNISGGNVVELHKTLLKPGEMLSYIEGVGFFQYQADNTNRLITSMEPDESQRIFQPSCNGVSGTFLTISGTAYYVYIGRAAVDVTIKFLELQVTTAGAGSQTAEFGLFTSPAPPNKSAQTLTKLAATGTVGSLTATGVVRNTSSFAQLVPAGSHLWAAVRFAMATTQPTLMALGGDMNQGHILTTTGGGALTGLSTASGSLVTAVSTAHIPLTRLTLD